jgi:hypothetical protein
MDKKEIFYRIIHEITSYIKAEDEYGYILACGRLRLLLLDVKLADQINKKYCHKIRFKVGKVVDLPKELKDDLEMSYRTLKPFMGIGREVSIDTFLAMEAYNSGGFDYTVKDIILFCANKLGGIHVEDPKTPKEINLKKSFEKSSNANMIMMGYGYITEICEIALEALQPIMDSVVDDLNKQAAAMTTGESLQ